MTETGKKWAEQQAANGDILRYSSPDRAIAAEFWLRAFCELLEERAESFSKRGAGHIERGLAFDELKRELLGD